MYSVDMETITVDFRQIKKQQSKIHRNQPTENPPKEAPGTMELFLLSS